MVRNASTTACALATVSTDVALTEADARALLMAKTLTLSTPLMPARAKSATVGAVPLLAWAYCEMMPSNRALTLSTRACSCAWVRTPEPSSAVA